MNVNQCKEVKPREPNLYFLNRHWGNLRKGDIVDVTGLLRAVNSNVTVEHAGHTYRVPSERLTPYYELKVSARLRSQITSSTQYNTPTINEEKPKMTNTKILVNALHENLNCVQVQFKRGTNPKKYSYKTFLDLEIGDECIVDSPLDGTTVVVVVGTDNTALEEFPCKWLVQKIDMTDYNELVEKEDLLIGNISELMSAKKRT